MRDALARHDEALRSAIESTGGAVFKTGGDAFYAVFARASDAVAAALTGQLALGSGDWSATGPLQVRMALCTGEASVRGEDYFGRPLNRCARILDAAHGGQILLSSTTAKLALGSLPQGASLSDLGEHRLRDLAETERIAMLVHPSLRSVFPPLRDLVAYPNNLPSVASTFVGRAREIAVVKGLLERNRIVTLAGPGGCGKTRLALQAAVESLDAFPDGVWFVDLAPLSRGALVTNQLASVLGLREEPARSAEDVVEAQLRDKATLVILDNCEHLIDACSSLAGRLVDVCSQIRVLATSREELRVPGERVYRVPPLSTPPEGPVALEDARACEAVSVFVDRASAVRPGFELTEDNAAAVSEICRRLDGIPLALELAAGRVKALSPEAIAARLDDRFRLLRGGSRTTLPRQQTLEALVDWSYELLGDAERLLFRRLSVFAGSFDLNAAEAICSDSALSEWDVLDTIVGLVEKSLIAPEGTEAESRYRLLESLRHYGLGKLESAGESNDAYRRHFDYYAGLVRDSSVGPARQDARIDREHDNIRCALEWATMREPERALELACELAPFWETRGHWSEGVQRLLQALGSAVDGPEALRARANMHIGGLTSQQGDMATAWDRLQRALAVFRVSQEPDGAAACLYLMGSAARFQGRMEDARRLLEEALSDYRAASDAKGTARVLGELAMIAFDERRLSDARALCEESLAGYTTIGSPDGTASALLRLGHIELAEGHPEASATRFADARDLHLALSNRQLVAADLHGLALAMEQQGRAEEAQAGLDEALRLYTEIGYPWGTAAVLCDLGRLARSEGDARSAAAMFQQCLAINRDLGSREGAAYALHGLVSILASAGLDADAARLCGAATHCEAKLQITDSVEREMTPACAVARQLAERLGAEVFARARESGRQMDLAQAAALAAAALSRVP